MVIGICSLSQVWFVSCSPSLSDTVTVGWSMDLDGTDTDLEEETVVRLWDLEEHETVTPTMCLIGQVLTTKPFNSFGLLEAMKKVMNLTKGFTAKEIGKNLFSFQFNYVADMREVLDREPWHFDKHILLLKELGRGEQPSSISFEKTAFWVRIYDLPAMARK
ncbi:hypothetical protein ACS0TY_020595 [Phlomoides rotata]